MTKMRCWARHLPAPLGEGAGIVPFPIASIACRMLAGFAKTLHENVDQNADNAGYGESEEYGAVQHVRAPAQRRVTVWISVVADS